MRKMRSEDYILFFLVIGFVAVSVLQMSRIPNYWAQYAIGVAVFLLAFLSTITYHRFSKDRIRFKEQDELEIQEQQI